MSGVADIRRGSTPFTLTRSVGAVVSPADEDLALRWCNNDSLQLIFRIEQPALEAHLAGLLGESLEEPLSFEPMMRIDRDGGRRMVSRLWMLLDRIDHSDVVLDHPLSTFEFEQSMMTDLLAAQHHNYSAALNGAVKPVGSREVRHAIALAESHPEWPLSAARIASTLSVSGRSLQRGFQHELGTTFRDVLHNVRLRRVHDDLLQSIPSVTSVYDVLARWGLPSEGYTFTAYRQRFGETPAETLHHQF